MIWAIDAIPQAELGEGTDWDSTSGKLITIDIVGQKIHQYDPKTSKVETLSTPSMVGFAVPDNSVTNGVIAGLQDGIYRLHFDGAQKELLARPADITPSVRFNDGKVAPNGDLFAGTMSLSPGEDKKPLGALYRLGGTGLKEIATDIHISNGLGWSPDNKKMYYIDTLRHRIDQFDYDVATGDVSNRRKFADVPREQGSPDGMTVDSQGRVVVALWGGSRVNVYNPSGTLADTIKIPAPQPSNVVFGGDDLKTLYVTTARVDLTAAELKAAPLSGKTFAVDMPIAGRPAPHFDSQKILKHQVTG